MDAMRRLVLIADIVDSRGLSADGRVAVQARVRRFLGARGAFHVSGGDEFEWVLPDEPDALDDVLRLRLVLSTPTPEAPAIRLRCGIGRGAVHVLREGDPYASDGPAFHRARHALRALRGSGARGQRDPGTPLTSARISPRFTGFHDATDNPVRDALLAHMDAIERRWRPGQREAIALAAAGLPYRDIGERLGVSLQAIAKRLQAAQWDLYLQGHQALKASWHAEDVRAF